MARTYTWSRTGGFSSSAVGGRIQLLLGTWPAGATFERVIFGFNIRQDVFYGGITAPPTRLHLQMGVLSTAVSAPVPDIDPLGTPNADWLWAGLISADVIPLHFASKEEYRIQFASPPEQLESVTRRHNGLAESQRVHLLTVPTSTLDSAFPLWSASSYGSVLYSENSP